LRNRILENSNWLVSVLLQEENVGWGGNQGGAGRTEDKKSAGLEILRGVSVPVRSYRRSGAGRGGGVVELGVQEEETC